MSEDKIYTVLVIDASETTRKKTVESLELNELKIKVFQSSDGKDGLKKIENQKFDLVICDMNTPKIPAKTLVEESKQVPKTLRPGGFIVLGENIEKEIISESKGGTSILNKDIPLEELNKRVKQIILPKKKSYQTSKPKTNSKANNLSTKMDVKFINPFISATLEVLDIMANVKAEKDFIFIKEDNKALGDITGIIPINSPKVYGSMSISFTQEVFLNVMTSMLGEDVTEINDENQDGVAELCNQIFGNAKASLNDLGYHLDMTTPKVLHGQDHKVQHAAKGSVVGVYFNTDFGTFVIECIAVNK